MEPEVKAKLDTESIKKLRESKAWTQEHLANAAGVSLRTIQRMEADGSASAESRLAIAAALDVPVEKIYVTHCIGVVDLLAHQQRIAFEKRWGYAGVVMGTIGAAAGIVSGSPSPEYICTALGILGAFAGIAAGTVGVLSRRFTRLA